MTGEPIFEGFYGLSSDPFRLTPDASLCFTHKSFRKARSYLEYGLRRREGFVMVTGEPGAGKTTLLEYLLAESDLSDINLIRLMIGGLEGDDLVRMLAYELGVPAERMDKAMVLRESIRAMDAAYRDGRRNAVIIDEAQALSESSLEQLRFLTNLQQSGQPLLQIFLVGQPGLRHMLQRPSLEQLQQRMIAACNLAPLTVSETGAYVEHRLSAVGWRPDNPAIDRRIYPIVHRATGGIPRRINQLMSRLFMHGFVNESPHVAIGDLREVLEELAEDGLLPTGCDVPWLMAAAEPEGGGPGIAGSSEEDSAPSAAYTAPRQPGQAPARPHRPILWTVLAALAGAVVTMGLLIATGTPG